MGYMYYDEVRLRDLKDTWAGAIMMKNMAYNCLHNFRVHILSEHHAAVTALGVGGVELCELLTVGQGGDSESLIKSARKRMMGTMLDRMDDELYDDTTKDHERFFARWSPYLNVDEVAAYMAANMDKCLGDAIGAVCDARRVARQLKEVHHNE